MFLMYSVVIGGRRSTFRTWI